MIIGVSGAAAAASVRQAREIPPSSGGYHQEFKGSHSVWDPVYGSYNEFDPPPGAEKEKDCCSSCSEPKPVEPIEGHWTRTHHELYDGAGNPIYGG